MGETYSRNEDMLHIRPADGDVCDIHDWATDGLARRLFDAMKERHGKGGVNSCRECIGRAKEDADRRRGLCP